MNCFWFRGNQNIQAIPLIYPLQIIIFIRNEKIHWQNSLRVEYLRFRSHLIYSKLIFQWFPFIGSFQIIFLHFQKNRAILIAVRFYWLMCEWGSMDLSANVGVCFSNSVRENWGKSVKWRWGGRASDEQFREKHKYLEANT